MATFEDYEACTRVWEKWARHSHSPAKILVCSGNKTQLSILTNLFNRAEIIDYGITRWNLDGPCPIQVDIIVACNVFHYAYDPVKWFVHCFAACKFLWLQDLFSRPRGPDGAEISRDDPGDMTRYGLGGVFSSNAPADTAFDLAVYKDRLEAYEVYDAGSFRECKALINFVACFRGDL